MRRKAPAEFLNRPLTADEIDEIIDKIVSGDEEGFLRWINNPNNNENSETVVSVVQRTLDQFSNKNS